MVAHFYYNIPRHHGKYGLAVSVYNSVEDRKADYDECMFARRLAYMKFFRFLKKNNLLLIALLFNIY